MVSLNNESIIVEDIDVFKSISQNIIAIFQAKM